ncbi:MAG TPA: hypothetical protein VIT83_04845, partial [Gammaproteobacteria bacterium]
MTSSSVKRFLASRVAALSVLLAFAFLLSLAGQWHWFADLFAHFVTYYLFAALMLFGLHVWLKQLRWSTLALLVAAGNGALLAPYL